MTGQLSGVCRYPAGALISVRSGAEIGLLGSRLSVSQGASLGDFLLASSCPIDKVTLWEGFLYSMPGSETDEGVAKDKVFARTGNRARDSGSKAPVRSLSTKLSLHPNIKPNLPYEINLHSSWIYCEQKRMTITAQLGHSASTKTCFKRNCEPVGPPMDTHPIP